MASSKIKNYKAVTEISEENIQYLSSGLEPTSTQNMFANMNAVKKIVFPKLTKTTAPLKMSSCTIMSTMFYYCKELEEVDFGRWIRHL